MFARRCAAEILENPTEPKFRRLKLTGKAGAKVTRFPFTHAACVFFIYPRQGAWRVFDCDFT